MNDPINGPTHYGGDVVMKFIESCGIGEAFCLGNVLKYIARAGKKGMTPKVEDLKKARWYLDRAISYYDE